jgi:hypothetical protein
MSQLPALSPRLNVAGAAENGVRRAMRAGAIVLGTMLAGPAQAADQPVDVDRLLEQFNASAPHTNGSIRVNAWTEAGGESDALVVVVEPRGEFKLVADPGITVTPMERSGVEWLVPLPYRHVDSELQYLTPPASLRLPFRASDDQPLEILVEYAYCVVDYQCFFGEQNLTVVQK